MILSCERCNTRYLVPPASLGPRGREVRCAQCNHSWFQDPPVNESLLELTSKMESPDGFIPTFGAIPDEPPPILRDIPEGSGLPVPVVSSGAYLGMKIGVGVLATVLVVILGLKFYLPLSHVPGLGALYQAIGLNDTRGVVVADATCQKSDEDKKQRYTFKGVVLNQSDEVRKTPLVRIVLAGKEGKVFGQNDFEGDREELKPGESMEFEVPARIPSFMQATTCRMEVGNWLELALRK